MATTMFLCGMFAGMGLLLLVITIAQDIGKKAEQLPEEITGWQLIQMLRRKNV